MRRSPKKRQKHYRTTRQPYLLSKSRHSHKSNGQLIMTRNIHCLKHLLRLFRMLIMIFDCISIIILLLVVIIININTIVMIIMIIIIIIIMKSSHVLYSVVYCSHFTVTYLPYLQTIVCFKLVIIQLMVHFHIEPQEC